jgi:glycosyltransferase involved in cell wall biosynthesis
VRPPRVVFLDQRADVAGAQVVLLELLAVSVEAGWETALAIPTGGALEGRVRARFGEGVTVHPLTVPRVTSGRKTPRDLWRIGAAAASARLPRVVRSADLVHVNGPRLYPAWWWANRRLRIPTVYHVHLAHAPLERWFIRAALLRDPRARVVANSGFVHEGLGGSGAGDGAGAGAGRLVLVGNALPRAMHALGFEDRWRGEPLRCAVIGALMPEKGHRVVLEAARALPEVEFHLAGPDVAGHRDYADALRREAPVNVRFHGGIHDIRAWIQAVRAQCAAVPSLRGESFGLAAVESMACSCLTLVADRGALPEIAAATGARLFRDAAGLAEQLRHVAANGDDRSRAEARAQYERVNAHYAPDRFAAQMRALYEERLG